MFRDEYLALLIAAVSLGGEKEEGWSLLYRIAASCGCGDKLQSLTIDAMTLKEDRLTETIRMICTARLERTFAIDSLMISHNMGADDVQLEFLAGLYELMKLEKNFLLEAMQFVKVVDLTLQNTADHQIQFDTILTARDIATYLGGYPVSSIDDAFERRRNRSMHV